MQQWARRYLQLAQSQTALHKRARTRAYLFEGVQTFRLSQAVEAVPAVLHVSVFLFFAGLVDFLFSIDGVVAHAMFGVVVFFGAIYLLLTFLPNVRPNCPYRTPFSRDALKWLLFSPTAPVLLALAGMNQLVHNERFAQVHMRFHIFVQSSLWSISDAIRAHQKEIEWRALLWTTATVDDDDEIEAFVEGIPGYVMSGTSKGALTIVEDLIHSQRPSPFGRHLERLLMTCIPEGYRSASELVRRRRSIICLDTARFLTGIYFASFSYSMFGFQTWRAVNSLKRDEDPGRCDQRRRHGGVGRPRVPARDLRRRGAGAGASADSTRARNETHRACRRAMAAGRRCATLARGVPPARAAWPARRSAAAHACGGRRIRRASAPSGRRYRGSSRRRRVTHCRSGPCAQRSSRGGRRRRTSLVARCPISAGSRS
ncbi:hypothetical protein EDB83DRAFT_335759 [Lactarius deliciosus]|nr:hypothetical protein EDB83DRAFT_335759 [Lactarius deliciosus]